MRLRSIVTLNRIFIAAVILFVFWIGAVLWFIYGWLPSYVHGEVVRIPDFRGMAAQEVEREARTLGLTINYDATETRFDSRVPRGHVIRHVPAAGQRVKRSRPIRFTISRGPEVVKVPQLRSKTLREADFELSIVGLQLGNVAYTYSDEAPTSEEIITSAPMAGAALPRGSKVDVLISRGPRPVRFPMPGLVGIKLEDARKVLDRYRLFVQALSYERNPIAQAGEVLAQSPGAGTPVEAGAAVRLTVNEQTTRGRDNSRLVIIQHRVSGSADEDVPIKIVLKDDSGEHTILNSIASGGQVISIPRTVVGDARLLIYERDMDRPVQEEVLR